MYLSLIYVPNMYNSGRSHNNLSYISWINWWKNESHAPTNYNLGKRFMACVAFNWTNHKTYKLQISFPAIIIGVSKSQDHHHQPIRKCVTTTPEWRKVNWRKQQSYTSQVYQINTWQVDEYETAPDFNQLTQNLTSECLLI